VRDWDEGGTCGRILENDESVPFWRCKQRHYKEVAWRLTRRYADTFGEAEKRRRAAALQRGHEVSCPYLEARLR